MVPQVTLRRLLVLLVLSVLRRRQLVALVT